MNFLTRLGLKFYFLTVLIVALSALLFVFNKITLENIYYVQHQISLDFQLRIIVGLVALALLLLNFAFSQIITGQQLREKNIAFDNPSGRVTIALTAMDDMIRRLVTKVPEVKEIRPSIIATKKGLEIDARLTLRSDANIPDLSSRLQDLIKRKVQDTIGLEGPVNVRIHIQKFTPVDDKVKRQKDIDYIEEKPSPVIPFQGYRA